MISHCGLNLNFPHDRDAEHLFIYLFVICMLSVEKYLFKSFAHFKLDFFFLLLSCRNSLYILDINPLTDT